MKRIVLKTYLQPETLSFQLVLVTTDCFLVSNKLPSRTLNATGYIQARRFVRSSA